MDPFFNSPQLASVNEYDINQFLLQDPEFQTLLSTPIQPFQMLSFPPPLEITPLGITSPTTPTPNSDPTIYPTQPVKDLPQPTPSSLNSKIPISSPGKKVRKTPGRKRIPDVDVNHPSFYNLPVAERSKIMRAKRNREAAHRSRIKNKLRQATLEDDTKKELSLNKQLTDLLDYLLVSQINYPPTAQPTSDLPNDPYGLSYEGTTLPQLGTPL